MIDAIAEVFSVIISFIYDYVPNFGAAIIIMTLMVKLVTFPLNNKQIKSAKRMQVLQPEMKKIQEKYKDDKEKQNRAVQEFMKENNMNPLAGCLPLLVQFPVLIGVFRLLREPNLFLNMDVINPYLFQATEAINLLNTPMSTLSVETFFSEISVYYIFPLIAGATTFLYSKVSMPADSSQKMLLYMMPVMITVFSFNFPVGLVIYWIMNNIFSLGQHRIIVKIDQGKDELNKDVKIEEKTQKEDKKVEKSHEKKLPAKKGTGQKGSARQGKGTKEKKDKEIDFFSVKPGEGNKDGDDGNHKEDKGNG
ncbi:MAG: YidC/Oxa1 family membrane protein insertase [Candidatus Humimicrobiaceae bacterium]